MQQVTVGTASKHTPTDSTVARMPQRPSMMPQKPDSVPQIPNFAELETSTQTLSSPTTHSPGNPSSLYQ